MQIYKQTTKFTCAAASLAMIINHFNPKFLLNVDNEFDIWNKTVALPTRGSSIYGLALYAHQQKIPVKIIVGSVQYKFPGYKFKSYKKKEIEIANFSSQLFLKKLKDEKIDVLEKEFTISDVNKYLASGKVLLLRLITGILRGSKLNKRNSHYFAIFGYKNGKYILMDPKKGQLEVDNVTMKEAFDKVKEVKRDPRMIIFG